MGKEDLHPVIFSGELLGRGNASRYFFRVSRVCKACGVSLGLAHLRERAPCGEERDERSDVSRNEQQTEHLHTFYEKLPIHNCLINWLQTEKS